MASFNPVKPTDFWDPTNAGNGAGASVNGVRMLVHEGQLNPENYLLEQQRDLHRSFSEINSDLETAKSGRAEQQAIVTDRNNKIAEKKQEYPDWETGTGPVYDALRAQLVAWLKEANDARALRDKEFKPWQKFLEQELEAAKNRADVKAGYGYANVTGGATATQSVSKLKLEMNVPAVKEAYLSGKQGLLAEAVLYKGNTPALVNDALNLWNSTSTGGGHKGRIIVSSSLTTSQADVTIKGANGEASTSAQNLHNYAFEFLYNPASITMAYSGIPGVDITMYTSGQANTNLWAPTNFQSTISFELILNRMFDLKYYDKKTGHIAKNAKPESIYGTRIPSKEDQKLICNLGTMYDMEYLLSATLGFKWKSKFRGMTADLGWMSAMPVDLHLGKSLRYTVVMTGVNVTHAIFDERMVPIFSVVRVECARIPDYPGGSLSDPLDPIPHPKKRDPNLDRTGRSNAAGAKPKTVTPTGTGLGTRVV
jgi:hypothetical protein